MSDRASACDRACLLHGQSLQPTVYRPLPLTHETRSGPKFQPTYQSLYEPLQDWQTRIIDLQPGTYGEPLVARLEIVDLLHDEGVLIHGTVHRREYVALSYCWGNPARCRSLVCNGGELPITEEAYRALQRLRQERQSLSLWVDAICINQDDLAERAQQVAKMLTIYMKARSVAIWLGEYGPWTPLLLNTSELHFNPGEADIRFSYSQRSASHICASHARCLIKGLYDILARAWFDRIWIKQEIWASREVSVYCGPQVFPWDTFDSTGWLLNDVRPSLSKEDAATLSQLIQRSFQLYRNLPIASQWEKWQVSQSGVIIDNTVERRLSILDIIRRAAGSQCSDPRDHIYALLGMCLSAERDRSGRMIWGRWYMQGENLHLPIDYTRSAGLVFADLAYYHIRLTRSLDVLLFNAQYRFTSTSRAANHDIGIPSWTPDWRCRFDTSTDWVKDRYGMISRSSMDADDTAHIRNDDGIYVLRVHGHLVGRLVSPGATDSQGLNRRRGPPSKASRMVWAEEVLNFVQDQTSPQVYQHWLLTGENKYALCFTPETGKPDDLIVHIIGCELPVLVRPQLSRATCQYIGAVDFGPFDIKSRGLQENVQFIWDLSPWKIPSAMTYPYDLE